MHESSLVTTLLRQVDDIAAEHQATQVTEVRIEVGQLSGVEPILISEAFERLKLGTMSREATLIIDDIGLMCRCESCQENYTTAELTFVCPRCGSSQVTVTRGDGVELVDVAMQTSGSV